MSYISRYVQPVKQYAIFTLPVVKCFSVNLNKLNTLTVITMFAEVHVDYNRSKIEIILTSEF